MLAAVEQGNSSCPFAENMGMGPVLRLMYVGNNLQ